MKQQVDARWHVSTQAFLHAWDHLNSHQWRLDGRATRQWRQLTDRCSPSPTASDDRANAEAAPDWVRASAGLTPLGLETGTGTAANLQTFYYIAKIARQNANC